MPLKREDNSKLRETKNNKIQIMKLDWITIQKKKKNYLKKKKTPWETRVNMLKTRWVNYHDIYNLLYQQIVIIINICVYLYVYMCINV